MQRTTIILLCLAIVAFAYVRDRKRNKPAWFQHLTGWQKLFGLIAFILALLIIINPEFLAIGLLGDATFFDMLVLALSLQMLVYVKWAWHSLRTACKKCLRWTGIPSPGLRYLLTVSALAIGTAISSIQKVMHRIFS
jgi:hypothetical protein